MKLYGKIKKTATFILPKSVYNYFKDKYGPIKLSYSQEGEDILLDKIFNQKRKGFYVDIGAYHPRRFSNTYNFYKRGWKGINIDPNPLSIKLFEKERPKDININIGIASKKSKLTYYMFNRFATNTFDKKIAKDKESENGYHIIEKKQVEVATLEEILDKHLPQNTSIDFIDIDVEGLDFEVIKSNNWSKYRAKIVLVEFIGQKIEEIKKSKESIFLEKQGYKILSKLVNTVVFYDNTQQEIYGENE